MKKLKIRRPFYAFRFCHICFHSWKQSLSIYLAIFKNNNCPSVWFEARFVCWVQFWGLWYIMCLHCFYTNCNAVTRIVSRYIAGYIRSYDVLVSMQCAELASGSDSTINCRSKGCGTIDFYNRSASSFKLGPSRIINGWLPKYDWIYQEGID